MKTAEVLQLFEETGALKRGHFILSSGLHSDTYLDKSVVSTYPDRTEVLCRALAEKIEARIDDAPDFVVSPAMGAIIYGYETARQLRVPFVFAERTDGGFAFRRFPLPKGAKVVVVEDIVSTGLSARECIAAAREAGADVLGLACLIDRSDGKSDVGVPLVPLAQLDVQAWPADALPDHLRDLPAVKPGSRGLA
ncbi:orotate phosphoribosyltransferase [Parvularcula dongshanensis]|uniref:Orotate phosphoribosyltransferase n=1 Tax=Parvularcula dongshanensis TaxID=1173995 RepID=A0A840I211_9PROT|nr:orotate phosphoribosyltransferase [Parvularcula dongshanensis]MBB4658375.1 orotate phosphoribosyltransferase [Parvularcula dongshanensis]